MIIINSNIPRWIPPSTVESVKTIDLLTYFERYNPQELVRISPNEYSTRTHDSLKISNGMWHWFSRGISHKSALDYLIHVEGMVFQEAVSHLYSLIKNEPLSMLTASRQETVKPISTPKPFALPKPHINNQRVVQYLTGRGINFNLLTTCIAGGFLYEDAIFHNAVFVGKDTLETPLYAFLRGTCDSGKPFKRDCAGSDKRFSFALPATKQSHHLFVVEGAVDALSVATLLQMHGKDWRGVHILSLGGVAPPKENQSEITLHLPLALEQYLKDHLNIRHVTLGLDNDPAGRVATQAIIPLLQGYTIQDKPPPNGKDYNETLQTKCRSKHIGMIL